jgi:hypothetical protein
MRIIVGIKNSLWTFKNVIDSKVPLKFKALIGI